MRAGFRAIELEGSIDEHQQLHLNSPVGVAGPSRVRVLILIPDNKEASETEWLRTAAANPAFAFLRDPEEDVYTLSDGKPFHAGDQG
jgi:hypothetical protein